MTPFAGWDMPLHYGSQVDEHHTVRTGAGLFDVSHMLILDVAGGGSRPFLLRLLANNVDKLEPGGALYSCMLNHSGGVMDDLVVYRGREADSYRLVLNAGNREKDLRWIRQQAETFPLVLTVRNDLAILAVQGPAAEAVLCSVLETAQLREAIGGLGRFQFVESEALFISRTGYTGEDGFELMLPAQQAGDWWQRLEQAGARPVGLGARDTLRLEAGMHLHGQDLDEEHTPLESGLGWTLAWEPPERDFIGRDALQKQRRDGVTEGLVGLLLLEKGVLRGGMPVFAEGQQVGLITSGGYSPTLLRSIALARIRRGISGACQVEIRGQLKTARVVKPVFVRNGKATMEAIVEKGFTGQEGKQ